MRQLTDAQTTTPPLTQRGFSLVEILVALSIISIVVLGFTTATITTIHSNKISQNYTIATTLAQDTAEKLKAGAVPLTNGNGCNPPTTGFTCSWTVTPDSPQTGTTQITATVSWTDYQPRSITLTTVVND